MAVLVCNVLLFALQKMKGVIRESSVRINWKQTFGKMAILSFMNDVDGARTPESASFILYDITTNIGYKVQGR